MNWKYTFLTILLVVSLTSCSSGSGPSSDDPSDPDDPSGTEYLLKLDFENSNGEWDEFPISINEPDTEFWDRTSGPCYYWRDSVIENIAVASRSNSYTHSGDRALLIGCHGSMVSDIGQTGPCHNFYYGNTSSPFYHSEIFLKYTRHFSLADFNPGDVATFSFWVYAAEPLAGDLEPHEHWPSLEFKLKNGGTTVGEFEANKEFFDSNLGTWVKIEFDLSGYTQWAEDITFSFKYKPAGIVWRIQNTGSSTILDGGGESTLVMAIDDIFLKVVPQE